MMSKKASAPKTFLKAAYCTGTLGQLGSMQVTFTRTYLDLVDFPGCKPERLFLEVWVHFDLNEVLLAGLLGHSRVVAVASVLTSRRLLRNVAVAVGLTLRRCFDGWRNHDASTTLEVRDEIL